MTTEATETMIHEILQGSKEQITQAIKDQVKTQIIEQLRWSMREEISKVTNKFVEDEMSSEIITVLKNSKQEILDSLKDAFVKIGAQVSIAMYEQACKNLETSSYHTKEIIKKILD